MAKKYFRICQALQLWLVMIHVHLKSVFHLLEATKTTSLFWKFTLWLHKFSCNSLGTWWNQPTRAVNSCSNPTNNYNNKTENTAGQNSITSHTASRASAVYRFSGEQKWAPCSVWRAHMREVLWDILNCIIGYRKYSHIYPNKKDFVIVCVH